LYSRRIKRSLTKQGENRKLALRVLMEDVREGLQNKQEREREQRRGY